MREQIRRNRALVPILSLAAVALFPGCSEDPVGPPTTDPATPRSWEFFILPAVASLEAGESIQLSAWLRHTERDIVRPANGIVQWETQDPKRAQVNEQGLLEVYEAGEIRVTAFLVSSSEPAPPRNQEAEAMVLVR